MICRYPWHLEMAGFPNTDEPWPVQAIQGNYTETEDEFVWISFWPLLNMNPMDWGCMPKWWYSQCMTFIFTLFVIMTLFNLINRFVICMKRFLFVEKVKQQIKESESYRGIILCVKLKIFS